MSRLLWLSGEPRRWSGQQQVPDSNVADPAYEAGVSGRPADLPVRRYVLPQRSRGGGGKEAETPPPPRKGAPSPAGRAEGPRPPRPEAPPRAPPPPAPAP